MPTATHSILAITLNEDGSFNRIPLDTNEPWYHLSQLIPCDYRTLLNLQEELTNPSSFIDYEYATSLVCFAIDNVWVALPTIHELILQNAIQHSTNYRWTRPGRRPRYGRFLRHPKTLQEIRNHLHSLPCEGEPNPRVARTLHSLPTAWDDQVIHYSRSWKKHRTTQYKQKT